MLNLNHEVLRNILEIILEYLNKKNLTNLMLCDKYLLKQVGQSKVWLNFLPRKTVRKEFEKFVSVKQYLINNSAFEFPIRIKDYYADSYYFYYFKNYFLGNFNLVRLLNTDVKDMERLAQFLLLWCRRNPSQIVQNFRYFVKHQQQKLREDFSEIPLEILEKIYLAEDFKMPVIIVNVENHLHPAKIVSTISYHLNNNIEYLFLPKEPCYCNSLEGYQEAKTYHKYFGSFENHQKFIGDYGKENYEKCLQKLTKHRYGNIDQKPHTTEYYGYEITELEIEMYFALLSSRIKINSILEKNIMIILKTFYDISIKYA